MNDMDDIPAGVDERTERLMSRVLDGEASSQEKAELASVLVRDPAARALLDQYERIDRLAATALRRDLAGVSASSPARFRGWRMGAAAALVSAAAVVGLSFLPNWFSPRIPGCSPQGGLPQVADTSRGIAPPESLIGAPYGPAYMNVDHQPVHRWRDLRQEFIGIPGETKDRIYIFERSRQTTRLVPVSGDI